VIPASSSAGERTGGIGATTKIAAIIGHPVEFSLSPAMHNAGFASLGLDWAYAAFDVAPGRANDALAAMRTLGIAGLSVTMPHKHDVAAAVDELDPAAAALRSVNTVVAIGDGRLRGHSTDGAGFVASLAEEGVSVGGRRIAVLGAGGAARSIIDALARHEAAEIVVINRTLASAVAAVELAAGRGRVGDFSDVSSCDIVINTTSVGMGAAVTSTDISDVPLDPALLRSSHVVADIVYHPRVTPLLAAAARVGATTVDGLGMLVHQAVLQEQCWTGLTPQVEVLREAAERHLRQRGQ
jgi:shikimate dehydrogenase